MSNQLIDNDEDVLASDVLRADDLKPAAAVVANSVAQQAAIRAKAAAAKFAPKAQGQVIAKENVPIKQNQTVDYSMLTEDDIYNMDIPMSARAFDSEDSLKVTLKDSGYVARWVNKNPQRLGQMLNHGFRYVMAEDLAEKLEIEVSPDASGHFCLFDVVLMRIPKERYFSALRAAHLRAVNSVGTKGMHQAAVKQAATFVDKSTGGGYSEESTAGKVEFYSPGITI